MQTINKLTSQKSGKSYGAADKKPFVCSCFENVCATEAQKHTLQCREVLWIVSVNRCWIEVLRHFIRINVAFD